MDPRIQIFISQTELIFYEEHRKSFSILIENINKEQLFINWCSKLNMNPDLTKLGILTGLNVIIYSTEKSKEPFKYISRICFDLLFHN